MKSQHYVIQSIAKAISGVETQRVQISRVERRSIKINSLQGNPNHAAWRRLASLRVAIVANSRHHTVFLTIDRLQRAKRLVSVQTVKRNLTPSRSFYHLCRAGRGYM